MLEYSKHMQVDCGRAQLHDLISNQGVFGRALCLQCLLSQFQSLFICEIVKFHFSFTRDGVACRFLGVPVLQYPAQPAESDIRSKSLASLG
jgi:hypothetical protein